MSKPSSLSKLLPTLHDSRKPWRCFPTQDSNLALLLDSENEKLHSCPVDINLNSCSQCSSFSDLLSLISISAMFYSSMLWTTEWLELLFPVLLGFLCKSKMADETQANEHSLQGFLEFAYLQHFQGSLCREGVVDSFSGVSFLWKGNWKAQKYMAPQIWLHNSMQPAIFWCTKRYDPHPICTSPQPDYFILRMIISLLFEPFRNSSRDHLHFVCAIWHDCIFVVTAAYNLGFVPQCEYCKSTVLHCVGVKRSLNLEEKVNRSQWNLRCSQLFLSLMRTLNFVKYAQILPPYNK